MLTFPGWTVIGLLRLCLSRYAGYGEYGHGRGVRGILGFKADAAIGKSTGAPVALESPELNSGQQNPLGLWL